ncbi:NADH:ubiquinone reductase (Na(+)-transporting) subunit A [Aureimonas mangrovi]|uniref:NADH:ubiquinone reductase (Na(+)-transporting) subunit A n=1 Tax=Aureimonas mangrovi TaxID=2758041 RepID=UPI00163D60D5|nr:NADH:ubiquinone reductase (Na(+)-transporting) subunit A [Aureimonas mangrovi]
MRRITIRNGLDLVFPGAPVQRIRDGAAVSRVAILGSDFPGLRPALAVEKGARVRAGERLFADRRTPEIAHVSPVAGVVREITLGRRRTLERIVIEREGDEAIGFALRAEMTRERVAALLLQCGLWPSFRTRPFGRTPVPGAESDAIFVTAIDTRPLSPDPAVPIAEARSELRIGLEALRHLTDGPVYLCQAGENDFPAPAGVTPVAFSGPHPAGLPGTHIHRLRPVGTERSVWHIGYDDVLSIGHLLLTGHVRAERIVSFAGPLAAAPTLLRTVAGASLDELAVGELASGQAHLLSGSPVEGRHQPFLGRFDLQISAMLPREGVPRSPSRLERIRSLFAASAGVLIPNAAHERAAPARILPVPFLRALGIGDSETASRLGALELCEEDMALLSHLDGLDYGALLRRTLDDLEAAR